MTGDFAGAVVVDHVRRAALVEHVASDAEGHTLFLDLDDLGSRCGGDGASINTASTVASEHTDTPLCSLIPTLLVDEDYIRYGLPYSSIQYSVRKISPSASGMVTMQCWWMR